MSLTHTVSFPELLWTIACAVALFYFYSLLRDALGDMRHLRSHKINGRRQDAARIPIVVYGMLVTVEAGFVLLGLLAMTLPSPGDKVTTFSYMTTAVFILLSIFLAIGAKYVESLRASVVRRLMVDILRREAEDM